MVRETDRVSPAKAIVSVTIIIFKAVSPNEQHQKLETVGGEKELMSPNNPASH